MLDNLSSLPIFPFNFVGVLSGVEKNVLALFVGGVDDSSDMEVGVDASPELQGTAVGYTGIGRIGR